MAGAVVLTVGAFLLLSQGAAIFAAPVTVPLMVLAARRHPTVAFRITAAVLGGLTVAEVVWYLTYIQLGEAKPWIWLLPLLGAIAAAIIVAAGSSPRRRGLTTG